VAKCKRCKLGALVLCNAITHQRLALYTIKEALTLVSKSGKTMTTLDKFHHDTKEAIRLLEDVEKEIGVDLDAD